MRQDRYRSPSASRSHCGTWRKAVWIAKMEFDCLFLELDGYRSTQIPGTATFWKRWGEATVESGYCAKVAWK
jgi:hypothetical protein